MTTPGTRIREARLAVPEFRKNQGALAKAMGVRREQISHWENDRYVPGGENLTKLARLLNTTGDWILYGRVGPEELWITKEDLKSMGYAHPVQPPVNLREPPGQYVAGLSRATAMLEDLDRPDEIKRFHSHVGIGSRVASVVYNAERRGFTRDELFEILHKVRKWASEAEDAINELHQKLRDRDRPPDDQSGA